MATAQESSSNAAALVAQGIPQSFIDQQLALGKGGAAGGQYIDTKDMAGFTSAYNTFQNSPQNQMNNLSGQMANLTSQNYAFDPAAYLPGITTQANAIYSPASAQLEAIRQLQNVSAKDTRIQTEKDFAKQMQQEVESINRRGSFFSGGAIQNEQDIRGQQASALLQQDLQSSAANFSNLSSQASLAAEKADFIQNRLINSESSSYARFVDARNFSFQALETQYTNLVNERNYARSVFESDRTYKMDVKRFEMEQKQFEQNYKITQTQFKQANEQFNFDMNVKKQSATQALSNFKSNYAVDNSGLFGVDQNGNDVLDGYANDYQSAYGAGAGAIDINAPFNIDNFILGKQ